MNIDRLDHLVLTIRDIEAACAFYTMILTYNFKIQDGSPFMVLLESGTRYRDGGTCERSY
jgi:catechol 2,3-dioxygenase-like lactoylglutathione lyase family enzyme